MHSAVEVRMRDHHPSPLPPPISINLQTCSPCQVLIVKVQSQPLPLLHLMETEIFPLRIFRTGEISCRLLLPMADNSSHLLLVTTHLFKQMATHSYLLVNKLLQLIITNKRPPPTKIVTTFSLHSLLLLPRVGMMELISIIWLCRRAGILRQVLIWGLVVLIPWVLLTGSSSSLCRGLGRSWGFGVLGGSGGLLFEGFWESCVSKYVLGWVCGFFFLYGMCYNWEEGFTGDFRKENGREGTISEI